MVDIQSAAAEIRRGIKKYRKKPQGKNMIMIIFIHRNTIGSTQIEKINKKENLTK